MVIKAKFENGVFKPMTTFLPGTADVLTTFMFLMERPIEVDNCDWFSRTNTVDSREYSPDGN